jgi:hypothetical protein
VDKQETAENGVKGGVERAAGERGHGQRNKSSGDQTLECPVVGAVAGLRIGDGDGVVYCGTSDLESVTYARRQARVVVWRANLTNEPNDIPVPLITSAAGWLVHRAQSHGAKSMRRCGISRTRLGLGEHTGSGRKQTPPTRDMESSYTSSIRGKEDGRGRHGNDSLRGGRQGRPPQKHGTHNGGHCDLCRSSFRFSTFRPEASPVPYNVLQTRSLSLDLKGRID